MLTNEIDTDFVAMQSAGRARILGIQHSRRSEKPVKLGRLVPEQENNAGGVCHG